MSQKTTSINIKMKCNKKSVNIKITRFDGSKVKMKYKMESENITSADISRLMTFLEILNK